MGKAISVVEAEGAVVEGKVSNVFSVDQVETRRVVDVGGAVHQAGEGASCTQAWTN